MNFIHRYTCNPRQLGSMIASLHVKNTPPIIDYIRESSNIYNYYEIQKSISMYPQNHFALKLSALGLNESYQDCLTHVEELIINAKYNESKILIDAENHSIQKGIENITDHVMKKFNQDDVVVYKTYQMYKKGAHQILQKELTQERDYHLGVKLVRGAYLKQDQHWGVLCENEHETHKQYDEGISYFVSYHQKKDSLICATHNVRSILLTKKLIKDNQLDNVEFAQLLGMSDSITDVLQKKGYKVYKYLPYGRFHESIPYLLRRLYENYPMIQYI